MNEFNSCKAKHVISQICLIVSFRKFGNAFRKHINPNFTREANLKSNGGRVCASFTWEDAASYIIGDGSYTITENEYKSFLSEFDKTIIQEAKKVPYYGR
jgi:hypothetical protein